MKKLLFSILFMASLLLAMPVSAQVRFSSSERNLEMTAKRIWKDGNTVTFTGTVTWYGPYDCRMTMPATGVRIVDDEGMVYEYRNIRVQVGNSVLMEAPDGFVRTDSFLLTPEVPFRFEITVTGVNEYATAFALVELKPSVTPGDRSGYETKLTCKGLAFPR